MIAQQSGRGIGVGTATLPSAATKGNPGTQHEVFLSDLQVIDAGVKEHEYNKFVVWAYRPPVCTS